MGRTVLKVGDLIKSCKDKSIYFQHWNKYRIIEFSSASKAIILVSNVITGITFWDFAYEYELISETKSYEDGF